MAITRAQQVRQMLEDGGMLVQPSMTGKRPGYRGDAAARSTGAKQSGRADPGSRSDPGEGKDSQGRSAPTAGMGAGEGPSGRDDKVDSNVIEKEKEKYEQQFFDQGKVPPLGSRPTSFKTKLNQRNLQKRLNYINYLQKQINKKLQKGLMDPSIPGVDVMTQEELLDLAPSVADLVAKGF